MGRRFRAEVQQCAPIVAGILNPGMKRHMQLVIASAMLLAMVGALFGAGMARLLWADDLKQAQRIDEIRSRTEEHLNRTIAALREHIRILEHKP